MRLDPDLFSDLVNGLCLMELDPRISLVLIQHAVSHLLRTCCELGVSLPWVRKDLLVSGKESQTLRGVPAQGESRLACSPVAIQGELKWGSSKDLLLVKGLSASRSNLERRPSSRGDHHHAATLPSRESSKKAPLGCHIYGIKWLARSQIAYNGRGMHDTPCTHNFLCSLMNESWKSHQLIT